jgi:hypothetical protein
MNVTQKSPTIMWHTAASSWSKPHLRLYWRESATTYTSDVGIYECLNLSLLCNQDALLDHDA